MVCSRRGPTHQIGSLKFVKFYGTHHKSHDELPALENLPLTQMEHSSAPAVLLYLPAAHGTHDPSSASDRIVPSKQRIVGAAVGLGELISEGVSHAQKAFLVALSEVIH